MFIICEFRIMHILNFIELFIIHVKFKMMGIHNLEFYKLSLFSELQVEQEMVIANTMFEHKTGNRLNHRWQIPTCKGIRTTAV